MHSSDAERMQGRKDVLTYEEAVVPVWDGMQRRGHEATGLAIYLSIDWRNGGHK